MALSFHTHAIPKQALLPFGVLFQASFDRLRSLWRPLLVPIIISLLLNVLTFVLGFGEGLSQGQVGAEEFAEPAYFLPLNLLATAVVFLLSLYASLVLFDQHKNFNKSLGRSFQLFFPYIGLVIWMFLRSFQWIPVIGFVWSIALLASEELVVEGSLVFVLSLLGMLGLLIYYSPRMMFAFVLLITKKLGIVASVRESMKRTSGHWWKIFGNYLLFVLCLIGIQVGILLALLLSVATGGCLLFLFTLFGIPDIAAIVIGIILAIPLVLAFVILETYIGYWPLSFIFELSQTIFKYPKKRKK